VEFDFSWRDGERTVRFGRGAVIEAPRLTGEGFMLFSTPRAREQLPGLSAMAATVVDVPAGPVDEIAGDLLEIELPGDRIVALGGGRVIDAAKAVAAALPREVPVAAIPTTLSAAEMTWVHRQARGAPEGTGTVRARLVINDPTVSASQPLPGLAASAANALGHAIEGACTSLASPVPTMAALRAARLLSEGLPASGEPDIDRLALGALLSGYAIDANWYGIHHVMSQTLVRLAGAGHGPANAAMLPVTVAALRERRPEQVAEVDAALGEPAEEVARRFAARAGASSLAEIGIDEASLARCAQAAAGRAELALTPPPAGADELLGLYEAAWAPVS
jgi:alcohol dehydrogenase class IV